MYKEITITFVFETGADFMFVYSVLSKKGGSLNELLVDYYIKEIANKFPDIDAVIPKIYVKTENHFQLCHMIMGVGDMRDSEFNRDKLGAYKAEKLNNQFFVSKDKIVNPIEVGIC